MAQWIGNLRLELGHQLELTPLHITEFAPALPEPSIQAAARPASSAPTSGYHPPPSKQIVSPELIFLSSPMGRSGVQQGGRFLPMSGVEKPMAACVWSMRPVFAAAALVHHANSVNAMEARPRSRAR